ncbi:DUF7446 family protein [Mycobacteroides abscessus]|uniref:DUF7446 family protein n=1 Tax=Mycobacteroides abscessus TaxID=36809 RepID=UPI00092A08F9|nr:hypothetical protein [Mycobacteroides abscessus]SIC86962.1 Uncharacterised protein [Mycobacteroides abscessus subsp. bolletii]SKT75400.1 Uncharacterised protein [Mycobacteroides abscessus subsp. bolletii]SLD35332.1 Uncharacterised protein [Mycobacteroides abscessus subsp. bolletii]SLF79552.1 Uncharacterised protein [Mycobacteroides abscessus subsp. bolletii]
MNKFGVCFSSLSGRVLVGRINKAGSEFLEKEDQSGNAIWAVAEWLEADYSGEPFEIFKPGGDYGYRLTVERIERQELER